LLTSKGSILLTGANGGIGGAITEEIIKSSHGTTHQTIYAVRDPNKASSLISILLNAPQDHKHQILPLDLSCLSSVRAFAANINRCVVLTSSPSDHPQYGVQDITSKHITQDRMERTFQVNCLFNFLLVLLLLQTIDREHGQIVFIASTATKLDWTPHANLYQV
jgi:short-subunit dehydrogenase